MDRIFPIQTLYASTFHAHCIFSPGAMQEPASTILAKVTISSPSRIGAARVAGYQRFDRRRKREAREYGTAAKGAA
jgi:hypothetical protein